jgi:hypothetical protein
MAALEADWAEHNITVKRYFEERLALINQEYEIQKTAVEKEIALTADAAKQKGLKAQLSVLEEQYLRNILRLQQEINQATRDEAQARADAAGVLADIDQRILSSKASGGGLQEQFEAETAQLLSQQEADIRQLQDLKAQGYDVEREMQAAHHKHTLEAEELAAQQRRQVWDTYVTSIHSTLSDLTSLFNDWYTAAGSKHKELFNLYKAASIAETIIATYSSAQKAYDAMAKIPYVGPQLAATAAGVAIAAGLARVQLIRQQEMAVGGEVGAKEQIMSLPIFSKRAQGRIQGVSPHPKADNILVHATAGEFMHPVDVVKYYGVRGMEIIRRKLIPREVIEYYATRRRTSREEYYDTYRTVNRQTRRLVDDKPIFIKPKPYGYSVQEIIHRAAGGLIPGVSPTPTSDNIPIKATAGEFMHPVSTVKHYGIRAMEAIRTKLVPREVLLQFAAKVPHIKLPTAPQYAAGGAITAAVAGGGGDTNLNMPVSIRLPEQLSFIGRRLESEIEPVILRVLQEEMRY